MAHKTSRTPLSSKLGRDVFFGTSEDLPRIIEVDLSQVLPNPDQPRKSFNPESLRELAASIERHGLIQPITVKQAEGSSAFLLVAGERRFRAFELLGRTSIPAILTTGNPEEIALIENIQREDLDPLEEAGALKLMIERHGYTQEQLGAIIGKAQNTVSQSLSLLKLPIIIKEQYKAVPHASKSILSEIARLKDEKQQLRLWRQVKDGKLTTVKVTRKQQTVHSKPRNPASQKAIRAGLNFLSSLESLERNHLALDKTDYRTLIDLYERLGALLTKLSLDTPEP